MTPEPARFPIMKEPEYRYRKMSEEERALWDSLPDTIPFDWVVAYAYRAESNHGQTLQRLAERGGLDPRELACVFQDKRLSAYPPLADAVAFLLQHFAEVAALDLCDKEFDAGIPEPFGEGQERHA